MAPSHHHVPPATFSLPWLLCLVVLGATSAIRGLRIPAESAAGRYLSSGVVQRSVVPELSPPPVEMMMADEEAVERRMGGPAGAPPGAPGAAGSQGGHWLGLGKRARGNDDLDDDDDAASRFTPYVSVGVLSNMQQFFDSLRTNLDSLEELPVEEKELLLGRAANGGSSKLGVTSLPQNSNRRRTEHRASRPTATAAYLHALRSHRPSHKLRNFVAQVEPAELRGSNTYDPAWLWAGLGRRRR